VGNILYSVTINVSLTRAAEWLRWMQDVHIPEVMATGSFERFRLHRLLEPIHDEDSITYNVQYEAKDYETYQHYVETHAPALRIKQQELFETDIVAFRTVLEVVS
jgi:hypothetical protein